MKKYIYLTLFFVMLCISTFAQSFAYVDSEYVLKHIPEYSSAQKQLDALAAQWQTDISTKFEEVDKMQKEYLADKVLLTDDMRTKRESEILKKQREVQDFQQQKFGFEGELYRQKIRLIKPVQEKIAKAIEEYANSEGIDIILDKSSVTLLFAKATYDSTNAVIIKLGYKPGSFAK